MESSRRPEPYNLTRSFDYMVPPEWGLVELVGLKACECFAASRLTGAADGHIISLRLKTIETHYFLCWSYFGWSVSVMGMLLNG